MSGTNLLRSQAETALGELVSAGLVNADSYSGLRALLIPSDKKRQLVARRRRVALFGLEDAGRWSLIRKGATRNDAEALEQVAEILLRRYGVVFRKLLEREADWLPPWHALLRVFRRLEAQGKIRGGRFVAGMSGEQYALSDAVSSMRAIRRQEAKGDFVSLSAADPLNLTGIITPGARVPALTKNRVLYRDGVPVAVHSGGPVRIHRARWSRKRSGRRARRWCAGTCSRADRARPRRAANDPRTSNAPIRAARRSLSARSRPGSASRSAFGRS